MWKLCWIVLTGWFGLWMFPSPPALAQITVVFVRHAEPAPTATDPQLSPAGKERAELLASMLSRAGVKRIYVTEYRRTQETAQPLAALLHLPETRIAARDTKSLVEAIRNERTGPLLVVGHGNTIPEVIAALGGPPVSFAEGEYNQFLVLAVSAQQASLLRLRYGKAPEHAPPTPSSPGKMLEDRSKVMKISFVRSGGFAGPATNVEGEIVFDDKGARIVAPGGYERKLAPEEAQQLRAAADPARLAAAQRAAAQPGNMRDAFQYDISVSTNDGKTHTLTVGDPDRLKSASPEMGQLMTSIQDEIDKIWAHRAGK